jgi:hypothetical protein
MPAVSVRDSPAHREFKPVILATGRLFTVTVSDVVSEHTPLVTTTLYMVVIIGVTEIDAVVSVVLHR